MLRPLERYDPSKGYLDSELEVDNKHSNACVAGEQATTEHARGLETGSGQAKKRSRSSLSARLEKRIGSARKARLGKAR